MKKSDKIEGMARMAGWYTVKVYADGPFGRILIDRWLSPSGLHIPFPDWLADHNKIQLIINRLTSKEASGYMEILYKVCAKDQLTAHECEAALVQATCEQKAEALLRLFDGWSE